MIIRSLLIVLALATAAPAAAEGLLKGASAETAAKKEAAPAESGGEGAKTPVEWVINGLLFLYFAPMQLAGDDWQDHQVHRPGQDPADTALGLGLDASYHSGLKIATLALDFAWKRLELTASGSRVEEWPADGPRDFLHTGKAGLGLRFVNTPAFRMRTSIGARGLFDMNRGVSSGGLNLGYGAEAVMGPVLARLDLEIGSYAGAFAAEAKGTLGVGLGPFELYGGYQNLDIGGNGLGGPLAGLKGRF